MKYVSYNKMYYKGKIIGKPYRTLTGKTKAIVEKKTIAYNRSWNKGAASRGYKAKLVYIRKMKR